MDNINNSNSILARQFLPFKKKRKKESKPKIKAVKNIFLTKTFASKLFIKLCREVIDPVIICLQTLKYEPENRKQEEIESTIPYLKTMENFNDFIQFLENNNSNFDLMTKFAKITFYHYHRKNSIIKRPGDVNDTFFILLKGNIHKYNLIFEIEYLTLEQYLLYLVELEILNEYEIINRCCILNKEIIDITNMAPISVENIFRKCSKLNYYKMQLKAENELIKLGYNSKLYKNGELKFVPSIDNYLKLFNDPGNTINDDGKNKFRFYLGKYKLCMNLVKGQFFNDISELNLKENNIYLCETNCDVGEIKKEEFIKTELNQIVNQKMKKLFSKIKNNFFILKGIEDRKFLDNYSNFFLYKKYKKGDIIFFQGGLYNGMYLILEGEISLTTSSSIEKLCNLLFTILNSIKSFCEYIPIFNSEIILQDFNKSHQSLYKDINITHDEYITKKTIDISIQKKFEIIGFYELINSKTELYNFTAECVSDNAILLFIPRNNLNDVLGKELNFYNSLITLVENKIQYIAGKFKTFVKQIIANYKMTHTKNLFNTKTSNSRYINNQNLKRLELNNDINSNKIGIYSKPKNDEKKNMDIIYNYKNLNNYNYYESINNFKKELNKKKKYAEDMKINKTKNRNLLVLTSIKFLTPKKININTIGNKLLNTNYLFNKYRNSEGNAMNRIKTNKSIKFNTSMNYNSYFYVNEIGDNNNEIETCNENNKKYKKFLPLINNKQKNIYY